MKGSQRTTSFYDAYTVHVYAYKAVRKKEIEEMRGYLMGMDSLRCYGGT